MKVNLLVSVISRCIVSRLHSLSCAMRRVDRRVGSSSRCFVSYIVSVTVCVAARRVNAQWQNRRRNVVGRASLRRRTTRRLMRAERFAV